MALSNMSFDDASMDPAALGLKGLQRPLETIAIHGELNQSWLRRRLVKCAVRIFKTRMPIRADLEGEFLGRDIERAQ